MNEDKISADDVRSKDKIIYQIVKKMSNIRSQVLSIVTDDSIEAEEAAQRLDAVYNNNTNIFTPDDWELFVTSNTFDIVNRCEAIECYLAEDFLSKYGESVETASHD